VEVDRHSQLPGGSYNTHMSIRHVLWKRRAEGFRAGNWGARARVQYPLTEQPTMRLLHSRPGHLFRRDTL